MHKVVYILLSTALVICFSCNEEEPNPEEISPIVKSQSSYAVAVDEDIVYAEGLGYNGANTSPTPVSLVMDVYYPENDAQSRPVIMFIHGGGFQGGTKTKPEIVNMANYFASRGWVFASIDYRTTEEMGVIAGMSREDVLGYYKGFAPDEWIDYSLQFAMSPADVQTSIAIYTAQRDAKAAMRWLAAHATSYSIDTDYITVGGASAGAISAIALGISDEDHFRDEVTIADDPTLSSTRLAESYDVKSMVYYWGADIKIELYEAIYGVNLYDRDDPELFMAHGTDDINPSTPYSEATDLKEIYDSLGIYSELVPLVGAGHGAWNTEVNGLSLNDMTYSFIVDRQMLEVR